MSQTVSYAKNISKNNYSVAIIFRYINQNKNKKVTIGGFEELKIALKM